MFTRGQNTGGSVDGLQKFEFTSPSSEDITLGFEPTYMTYVAYTGATRRTITYDKTQSQTYYSYGVSGSYANKDMSYTGYGCPKQITSTGFKIYSPSEVTSLVVYATA